MSQLSPEIEQVQEKQSYSLFRIGQMQAWQKKRLITGMLAVILFCSMYIGLTCSGLIKDKQDMYRAWDDRVAVDEATYADEVRRSTESVTVACGSYVDYFKQMSLKEGTFRTVMLVWFRWQGAPELDMKSHYRFYCGTINSSQVVKDEHYPDGTNYQLLRVDVSVAKDFSTNRFPLDSHQLNFYLESDYPIEQVVLQADVENSGLNSSLDIPGYRVLNYKLQEYAYEYATTHGDPGVSEKEMSSEVVTSVQITRDGFGLYLKCFIALLGTTLWVFISLYICTQHRVDPLGMIPGALFGAVGNIMVGANLVPDALTLGLLEYVNLWGVVTIVSVGLCVININRIRSFNKDNEFAQFFGRVMLFLLLTFILAGHILMPVCAYL